MFVLICSLTPPLRAETFFGTAPTGLLELSEYKYPVMLYVPDQYKPARPLPMIIVFPGIGENLEDIIEDWKGYARRNSFILLVPALIILQGDVPYPADQWLLRIKKDITNKYRIAEDRVYLVGKNEGGEYVGYLGLRYPEEFSAVAMLNAGWADSFMKLVHPSKRPAQQVPFFVSFETGREQELKKTENRAYTLTEKGYPIYLEKLQDPEKFSDMDFKKRLFNWLEEKNTDWQQVTADSLKSPGERIRGWFRRNILVR